MEKCCTCIIPDLLWLRHLEANSCWRSLPSARTVRERAVPSPPAEFSPPTTQKGKKRTCGSTYGER